MFKDLSTVKDGISWKNNAISFFITGLPVASPVYKVRSIFLLGEYFWEVVVGVVPSSSPNLDTISEQYI